MTNAQKQSAYRYRLRRKKIALILKQIEKLERQYRRLLQTQKEHFYGK